jgi:hypothetical protein
VPWIKAHINLEVIDASPPEIRKVNITKLGGTRHGLMWKFTTVCGDIFICEF